MRLLFLAAVAGAAFAAAVPPPQASGAPVCTYTCPEQDKSGFVLVGTHPQNANSVRCDYYAISGIDNNSFTCTYNTANGSLLSDNDDGFCKSKGKQTCTAAAGGKRDANGVFAAYQRQAARRATQASSPVPQFMNERAALGKRKYLTRRSLCAHL